MKLILNDISCDYFELSKWKPRNLEDIYISVVLDISLEGFDGSNLFYVTISTPEALRKNINNPILVLNRTIIIADYSYSLVNQTILSILDKCAGSTWEECCLRLQRYFEWEYEDFICEST